MKNGNRVKSDKKFALLQFFSGKTPFQEFNQKFNASVDSYAAEKMTEQIECKILMFHDKDDREIPIECSRILN